MGDWLYTWVLAPQLAIGIIYMFSAPSLFAGTKTERAETRSILIWINMVVYFLLWAP